MYRAASHYEAAFFMHVHVRDCHENVRHLSPKHQVAKFLFNHSSYKWIVIM